MILADKIIGLRKKNGWSQEELAEKMNVSRQAVSKWEAAQTTPDLGKILQLADLFGVTTDYLLKDEMENEEFSDITDDTLTRKITLAQANEYLNMKQETSVQIAKATFLCIFSVIPLLLLIAFSGFSDIPIMLNLAVGIGLVVLLLLVAIAVSIFIRVGFRNTPYEFLEKEPFEAEYGVAGLVREKQKNDRPTYIKYNIIGICSCIVSPVPLICAALTQNGPLVLIMLCVTLLIVAGGVAFLIIASVRWESMQILLKEGDFSDKKKQKNQITETIETAYWLMIVAVYLGWSFLTQNWNMTWIIWPIAALLFALGSIVIDLVMDRHDKR